MSFSILPQASPQERVETRRLLRNLDNFLSYDFATKNRLSLSEAKVHGYAVQCLEEIDSKQINWKNYPNFWWHDNLNLKKITQYVAAKASVWEQTLQNDDKRLVALERQCALLEKVVANYNQKVAKKSPLEDPISFINPFRKSLRVVVSYPAVIGRPLQNRLIEDIVYDRLTTAAELADRFKAIIEKPVLIKVIGKVSLQSSQEAVRAFSVSPKNLFRKESQELNGLFDPADNQVRDSHQTVMVTYDDPSTEVLSIMLFDAGEKQSLSHVYQQGYLAGRNSGYLEALQKVQAAFSGK